jgi:hypothetical protein
MRLNPDEPAPDLDPEQSFGYPLDEVTPRYRVYQVQHMVTPWGGSRFVCPICGTLPIAALGDHGPEHFIEDAST